MVGYACLVSLNYRNIFIINGGDVFLAISLFLLMFSPCGEAVSVDRLGKIWKKTSTIDEPNSFWPVALRLIQIQIAVVYFQAFWSKVAGSPWIDGTAVYWVLREQEYLRFPVPIVPDHLWICQLLTWSTLLIELGMWTLIWIKEFRYPILVAATCLHLGIDYALNLPNFETIMVFSYVVFIAPPDLSAFFSMAREAIINSVTWHVKTIIYDNKSDFANRMVETISSIDSFGHYKFKKLSDMNDSLPESAKQRLQDGLGLLDQQTVLGLPRLLSTIVRLFHFGYDLYYGRETANGFSNG